MVVDEHDLLTLFQAAALHSAYAYAADVIRIVERGNEHLQGRVFVALGRGHMGYDRFEERGQIGARFVRSQRGGAGAGGAVDYGAVQLLVGGVEVHEKLEHLVHHFGGAGVGTVHFVYDDDHGQAEHERVFEHETRLRHSALKGIDEQDDAVDHFENALHFAAEIGVAGRVNDVDFIVPVSDGSVLCEYGYAAFSLEIVGVHDALGDGLVGAEGAALSEHLIDQRGLAVVDVRDYRDIAYFFVYHNAVSYLLTGLRAASDRAGKPCRPECGDTPRCGNPMSRKRCLCPRSGPCGYPVRRRRP